MKKIEKIDFPFKEEKRKDFCSIKERIMKIYSSAEDAKKSQFFTCYAICGGYNRDCVDYVCH